MPLHFLDFDYSEDDTGVATWDAMASVAATRLMPLVAEIESILGWAHELLGAEFGPQEEGGLWQYDLQCERQSRPLMELHFDPQRRCIALPQDIGTEEYVTLSLSLSGEAAFADAFTERFGPF